MVELDPCQHDTALKPATGRYTATAAYERHRGGFQVIVHGGTGNGRYQVLSAVGQTAEQVVQIAKNYKIDTADVKIEKPRD